MSEKFIYEIFLDLHKAYDALEQEICLYILAGYGVVTWVLRLLITYCEQLTMVEMTGRYHRPPFKGLWG